MRNSEAPPGAYRNLGYKPSDDAFFGFSARIRGDLHDDRDREPEQRGAARDPHAGPLPERPGGVVSSGAVFPPLCGAVRRRRAPGSARVARVGVKPTVVDRDFDTDEYAWKSADEAAPGPRGRSSACRDGPGNAVAGIGHALID